MTGHKSLVATATSGSVVAALVATIAIVSGGYEAKQLDLGDASVWVANSSLQVIGRANTEILALDTVVESAGTDIQVVQDGSHVLLVDATNNRVDIVDSATAQVSESVPLPAEASELFLAGDNVVIHSTTTGAVWILPTDELADFDAEQEPSLSYGVDSEASVTPTGILFVYSPETATVYRVDAASSDTTAQTTGVDFAPAGTRIGISSVDDRWVLLDSANRSLSIQGVVVDLGGVLPENSGAILQSAADDGGRVLVSYDGGLVAVPLTGGAPVELATDVDGIAVAPLVNEGCTYAAWSSGVAWRECEIAAAASAQGAVSGSGGRLDLRGVSAGASQLEFVSSGARVVLSDPRSGGVWAVQATGQSIDNWNELISREEDQLEVEKNDLETPPEY